MNGNAILPKEPTLSEIYAERLARRGIPLESWCADADAIRAAWAAMEATPGLGLIVGGKVGRGKTTLVHAMIDYPQGNRVQCFHTSSRAEMQELQDAQECPPSHLFIDDIWSDSARMDYGTARDPVGEYLTWWLDKRSWRGWTKRLFLTTNGTVDDLTTRYGVRLVSRIMDACWPLTLKERNWRNIRGGTGAWKEFGK